MTKKELIEENRMLKLIIKFYFDYDCDYEDLDTLKVKVKKMKSFQKCLNKIFIVLSVIFLCGAFYLLGLSN